MRRIQGKQIVGYVTVHVKGKNPETFFQICADANIPVWNIQKQKKKQCSGQMYFHYVKKMQMIAKDLPYEVEITDTKGSISLFMKLWKRKKIMLSIVIFSVIIFFLSNLF